MNGLRPSLGQRAADGSTADRLLAWYDRHRRDLPWRARPGERPDPYAVWLSEVMLQQTTVAAVKPYFAAFLRLWPTVADLAAAPVEDVMRAWAGLGYYSRARNLHACARAVATRPGAQFPDDEQELLALPGVGPYTAAALAAIGFGRRAIVVDGNVERVVSRLCAISDPTGLRKRRVRAEMEQLTPARRAGDFAQAMMDLGATVCMPRRPRCEACPLAERCRARASCDPQAYPVRTPRLSRPRRWGVIYLAQRADGAILVRTRAPSGLLGGMTEFPGSAWGDRPPTIPDGAPLKAEWRPVAGEVEHVFSHFALTLIVCRTRLRLKTRAPKDCRWASPDLDGEALPSVMKKALALARRDEATADAAPSAAGGLIARRRPAPATRGNRLGKGA